MAASADESQHRTGDASTVARSSGRGRIPAGASAPPIWTTWLTIATPICARRALAHAPAATLAAVSRAEARSSTSRASSKPYFCMPARSAWPGRGCVSRREGCPGSGDISASHLGHSAFAISIATGDPKVRPWRTPPRMLISSVSNRWRGPRPKPSLRRASSPRISSAAIGSPAGRPSMTATSARPWDSPAVRKRSTGPAYAGARPEEPSMTGRHPFAGTSPRCSALHPLPGDDTSSDQDPVGSSRVAILEAGRSRPSSARSTASWVTSATPSGESSLGEPPASAAPASATATA